MTSVLLLLLLVVANVFGAGMIVPQVSRLYRTRVVDGISGTWVGIGISMNAWWLGYAIAEDASGLIPVSIAGVTLYSAIAWLYTSASHQPTFRSLAFGGLVLGSAPLPMLIISGWSAAGLVIGLSYGVQFAPAAISAARSATTNGIAPATWIMAWIEAVVWFVYGLAIGDRALLVGGAGGAVIATVILVRVASNAALPARHLAPLLTRRGN